MGPGKNVAATNAPTAIPPNTAVHQRTKWKLRTMTKRMPPKPKAGMIEIPKNAKAKSNLSLHGMLLNAANIAADEKAAAAKAPIVTMNSRMRTSAA
jgi:hypothetical protein